MVYALQTGSSYMTGFLSAGATALRRRAAAAEAAAAAHGLAAARGRWRWRADGGGGAAALLLSRVAVDMLPRCRRSAGVAVAARRDHDGYSMILRADPSYPTPVALFRLAHAEKNSDTACTEGGCRGCRV